MTTPDIHDGGAPPSSAVGPAPIGAEAPNGSASATIDGAFVDAALAHPAATALRSPAGEWTYRQLLDLVERQAAVIRHRVGAAGPSPIALLADHDGPLVATVLSILAAGQIVVILDPMAPEDVTVGMLAECTPALLLHDASHADMAAALRRAQLFDLPLAAIESLTAQQSDGPADAVDARAARSSDDPAMLAFTSGTSGAPKAAIITHGVLQNVVEGATEVLGIGPSDRMPMLFPPSLAVAAYPMFLPLVNGGTLATLDVRSVGLAPMGEFLRTERITLAYMAPTVIRFLADSVTDLDFPDLRMVALGGELVDAEAVALTRESLGPAQVAIGYGTTETGVVALNVLGDGPPPATIAVGRPTPGIEIVVLDAEGRALPADSPGEVAVIGRHLFHGYWNHPELNRQVLDPDPMGRPGWSLYRTGDYGSVAADGTLTISGRLDSNVKIRGRFVVLGDVEAVLHERPEVADAAVVARKRHGADELVAYVVPSPGASVTGTELRASLLEHHDAYETPSTWVFLDELPRLPNGKLDRRALPSADAVIGADRTDDAAHPVADAGDPAEIRARVKAIWERLLPVGAIGLDEDFFHLGGDSLLAAQMLVAVEHELGITVPMSELVHAHTVRELAEAMTRRSTGTARRSTAVCVQAGDPSRPILWLFPDLQGSAYRVRHVAAALGDDQPVWSFESPLLAGERNPYRRLGNFVVQFVDDMREVQPDGPYWVAGYSFGGICAYEVARQLLGERQEIGFLGVIDVGPGYRGPGWHARMSPLRPWFGIAKPPEKGASAIERVRHYTGMVRRSPLGALRHLEVRTGVSRLVDPLRFRNDLRTSGRVRPEWRLWYAWEEHWRMAATAWARATRLDGRVDLFWADDSASADATMGWGPLVDDLRVHRFAGDHEGVLEARGAGALAVALRTALDDRIAEAGPTGTAAITSSA